MVSKGGTMETNAPATAEWNAAKGELSLEYHGTRILSATVTAVDADGTSVAVKLDSKADIVDEKGSLVAKLNSSCLVLSGDDAQGR